MICRGVRIEGFRVSGLGRDSGLEVWVSGLRDFGFRGSGFGAL